MINTVHTNHTMLYCTELICNVLHCTALYYSVLCCNCFTTQQNIIEHRRRYDNILIEIRSHTLHYSTSHHTILNYTLHHIPHHITSNCTTPHITPLHFTLRHPTDNIKEHILYCTTLHYDSHTSLLITLRHPILINISSHYSILRYIILDNCSAL